MAELWFIGLGLGDESDLSGRALEALASAGKLFVEEYTSRLSEGALGRLSERLGRPLTRLTRAELESERPIREALDAHDRVALLVVGDPFVATTHVSLRLSVTAWGHRWRYLPNVSVLTAVPSLLGLMHYRFGRVVSIPLPEPSFAPRSPLEGILSNRAAGLHTLLLLDLRPEEGRFLTAGEAIALLAEREETPPRLFSAGLELAVAARVGQPTQRAWYGPWEELLRTEFGPPLHSVVVPAPELHFTERAALESLRAQPPPGGAPGAPSSKAGTSRRPPPRTP